MNGTHRATRVLAVVFSILLVASAAGAGALSSVGVAQAQQASDVLYRVNAGGSVAAADGGPDWASDAGYLVSGDSDASSSPAPDSLDASVPDSAPAGIWTNERYDPPSDGEMQYEFDVQSGQQVEVRLYFYDGYSETSSPGDRVFDASVEDQTVESFDPIAEYGDQTAGMESFTVVSDGTIDVDFAHVTENPQLNAVEIVSAEPQPNALGAPSTVDVGTVVAGSSATEQITLTNLGAAGDADISITDVSVAGADADEFSAGAASATTLGPGETASVPVTFAPSDAQPESATLEVSHSGSNSPVTVDLSGEGASDVPVGFGVSGLGADLGNPTSLDFGPDGRLYVAQQSGEIKAFEITRNGENDYEVVDTEVITAVQDVPNHDDDGAYNPNVGNRQVTGLTVEGTAETPVLYVTSSDPRIGAGGGHTDSGLDTNSGVVSRLTRSDSGWDHDMLVRGLPRSEENHATNGIQYDAEDNVLYVAQGGHTNKGAPSDNFALTPEYALSAAILEIDLTQVDAMAEKDAAHTDATYLYDLPTLQGTDEPFGGQDGANMANWTADSPVDVYSPGFRNPYDIALSADGQLYATDNSANPGWGGIAVNEGPQGQCTNAQNEQNEYSAAGVYHIEGEDYYGGHPNPTRGNDTSEFAAAVDDGLHDPINCDYISPTNSSSPSEALETFGATPQGMDVYPASNFGGALQGDLLLAMWNSGDVQRVELNAQGTAVTASEPIFQNIGSNPLDVHAQGDDDTFPGTVWAATYGSNKITVFEPNDYGGATGGQCVGADPNSSDYDPGGDADGDGYTNADENASGTDPCSQASQPEDWDQDDVPDSVDDDDDNDGLTDGEDPFAVDPQNGLDNELPVDRQFEAGQHPQSLFGLGFTGLMTNGTDYADLYNASQVRAGGATERLSVDEVPFGDAYTNKNSQSYAFQYGVNATGDAPFTVHTTVESPFSDDMTPENWQAAGLQMGTGDQDNYFKLVAAAQDADGNPNGGVQFVKEVDGQVSNANSVVVSEPDVFGSGQTIELYLDVYPSNDTVEASYAIDEGERVYFDQTFTMPESWYADGSRGLAVGLISTANGASSTFSASWDRLTVTEIGANAAPTADAGADRTVDENESVTLDASGSSDADGDELGYSWTQTAGPDVQLSAQDDAVPSFVAPDVDGNTTLTFEVGVSDAEGATDTDAVNVTVVDDDQQTGEVVFAVNAGGSAYTAADGTVYQADTDFDGGSTTAAGSAGIPSDPEIGDTDDDALYQTERYGNPFGYDVPVDDGTYEVTLQFAEIYQGVSSNDAPDSSGPTDGTNENDRVFNASIEGEQVLTNYDLFASVGPLNATEQAYTVEVTDGTLNVDFAASVDNAKVSALTVEAVDDGDDGDTNQAPSVDAVPAQTVAEGSAVAVNVTASDPDGDALTLSASGPDFLALADEGDGNATLTLAPESGDAGTYAVEVTASDGAATATATVQVTVEESTASGEAIYRINSGGSAYTDVDGNQWSADDYFDGGTTTNVSADYGVTDIGDTEDDALYTTERYGQNGAPVSYSLPVADGTYEVTLHFAEIWFGTDHGDAGGDGSRVMSANVEGGESELAGYDIHADVGALNATTKTYTVDVTDGDLDVNFTSSVENPKVSAIEVVKVDGSADGPTDGEATVEIDDGEGIDATTWDAESFEISNTGDEPIETVTLNLNSAVLPDAVFDPDGTAGDQGAKGFVLDDNATSGTVDATVLDPHNGVDGSDGYDTLQIAFGAFEPGESISFEMDNDPTSIKGGSSVQSGEAGPISGLELSGAEMTVDFADGSTTATSLFGDGSAGGSQATADADVSAAPTVGVANVSLDETTLSPDHAAATVTSANQTITVEGEPGSTVTLLRVEGELNLDGVPTYDGTPGYDVEAYEANTAIQVEEYAATVGADGTAEIPVTLTNSSAAGGLNYFIATAADGEGETGLTSNVAVLEYAPSADAGPEPVGDFENAPTDPDGDGVYEDVNGDGTVTVSDAQALFANLNDPVVQGDVDAFDVNGDGAVTAGDAQALFADLVAGS